MSKSFLFEPAILITEFFFTLISVILCFLIYSKTKEMYELTKHEGINYFREAFLLFGISYLIRFFFIIIFASNVVFDFLPSRKLFLLLFILPLSYLSTLAIFYLLFSSIWKKFNKMHLLFFGHGIAMLLLLISFLTRSHKILLYLQSLVLIIVIILNFAVGKESIKKSQVRIFYLLVSVLWLINLWIIGRKKYLSFGIEVISEIISVIILYVLYYKISKWIK